MNNTKKKLFSATAVMLMSVSTVGGKISIQTNAQMKKRWVETYRDKYLEMLEDEELMGEYIKNFGKKEIKELFGLLTQTYEAMDLLEKHN